MVLSSRRILSCALAASLLMHVVAFFYDEIPTWLATASEAAGDSNDVLSRKKGGKVPKVRLSAHAKENAPKPVSLLHIRLITPKPPKLSAAPTLRPKKHLASTQKHRKPAAEEPPAPQVATGTPPPLPTADSSSATATPPQPPSAPDAATTAIAGPTSTPTPASEPAKTEIPPPSTPIPTPSKEEVPVFPDDVTALFRLRYSSYPLSADIKEHWHIDNGRYALALDGQVWAFKTFKGHISSDGTINEAGLSPEHYRVVLNDKLKTAADFSYADHMLHLGDPSHPNIMPFPQGTQDMFSFAYHLALTFADHNNLHMTITNGNQLYDVQFSIAGEEVIALPAGTVRTVHLVGTRQAVGSTRSQSGYEAWLALNFSNFPVKMRGPDSNGRVIEMTLKTLDFAGKPLFGKDLPPEKEADKASLPKELHNMPEVQSEESNP